MIENIQASGSLGSRSHVLCSQVSHKAYSHHSALYGFHLIPHFLSLESLGDTETPCWKQTVGIMTIAIEPSLTFSPKAIKLHDLLFLSYVQKNSTYSPSKVER